MSTYIINRFLNKQPNDALQGLKKGKNKSLKTSRKDKIETKNIIVKINETMYVFSEKTDKILD